MIMVYMNIRVHNGNNEMNNINKNKCKNKMNNRAGLKSARTTHHSAPHQVHRQVKRALEEFQHTGAKRSRNNMHCPGRAPPSSGDLAAGRIPDDDQRWLDNRPVNKLYAKEGRVEAATIPR